MRIWYSPLVVFLAIGADGLDFTDTQYDFLHSGAALDWRHEPFQALTDVPAAFDSPAEYPVDCAARATSCFGDIDLAVDSRARYCANLTDGNVVVSGTMKYPPYCLQTILNGSVLVEMNPHVTMMTGFGRLQRIDGDLVVSKNRNLVSLRGLEALRNVVGSVVIAENGFLLSLSELDDLVIAEAFQRQMGDSRLPDSKLYFPRRAQRRTSDRDGFTLSRGMCATMYDEDILASLSGLYGLEQLETVGGDLQIENNPELLSLVGLRSLLRVGGSVSIKGNKKLLNLVGATALNEIGQNFHIQENPSLQNIEGLMGLGIIGGDWTIARNERLVEIGSMPSLINVLGNITIWRNDNLVALAQTKEVTLEIVGGAFIVEDNPKLQSLRGFGQLHDIAGTLYIARNPALLSLANGFSSLQLVGGDVYVQGAFSTYAGFETLQSVGGSLVVHSNPNLVNLAGFNYLTSIGRDLVIHLNSKLTSIDGLQRLSYVRREIQIYENALLSSIDLFLDALGTVEEYLRLEFVAGKIHCPEGSGVKAGAVPLIHDTTSPLRPNTASVSFGNWCTLSCRSSYKLQSFDGKRMWESRENDLWGSNWGPKCVKI